LKLWETVGDMKTGFFGTCPFILLMCRPLFFSSAFFLISSYYIRATSSRSFINYTLFWIWIFWNFFFMTLLFSSPISAFPMSYALSALSY
jgi:hypothetical protein